MSAGVAPPGRRARSPEAKRNRRGAILRAARSELTRLGFAVFTMAALAKGAGLAKGTPYLYFASREEVLLTLAREDLAVFFAKLDRQTIGPKARDVARATARRIAEALISTPGLIVLLQLLHTQLERNVSDAALAAFKSFLLTGLARAGAAVEVAARLPKGAGVIALLRAHALAVGFAQMAERSPALDRVFAADPKLAPLAIAFEPAFTDALADQLRGLARTR